MLYKLLKIRKLQKTVHFDVVDLGISQAIQAINKNKKVAKTVHVLIAGCPG